jgi:hypothetical protein
MALAENDDHLLMVADSGEGIESAIIRCTIPHRVLRVRHRTGQPRPFDVQLLGARP